MKTYFIADDNGTVYAHDIRSEYEADCILDAILKEHPEYKGLNLEILVGTDEESE